MIEMPWKARAKPDSTRDYTGVVTYLPMRRVLDLPRWPWSIRAVMKQLARSPGLIGYSLRTNPFRLQFWTLSVWEDEQTLRNFVRSSPHVDIQRTFGTKMPGFWVSQWTVAGTDAKPTWADALSRLRAHPTDA